MSDINSFATNVSKLKQILESKNKEDYESFRSYLINMYGYEYFKVALKKATRSLSAYDYEFSTFFVN